MTGLVIHSLLVIALASVALAGCAEQAADPTTGGSAPIQPAAAPEPKSDTGSLVGVVTDDESNPVAGVSIVVVETLNETKTDQAGAFTINGLPTGTYKLLASRAGYREVGRSVEITAATITEVELQIEALAIEESWVQLYIFNQAVLTGNYNAAANNDVQAWRHAFDLEDNPYAMVDMLFEVDWEPSSVLADGIQFFSGIDNWESDRRLCDANGNDPLVCPVPREALAQDWNCDFAGKDDCRAGWMFRPGGSSATLGTVGLWPTEGVTVYVSHFFRTPMAADYSAVAQ